MCGKCCAGVDRVRVDVAEANVVPRITEDMAIGAKEGQQLLALILIKINTDAYFMFCERNIDCPLLCILYTLLR